jgi:DNA-directed RNA polymerase subunit RPC12/RpoP
MKKSVMIRCPRCGRRLLSVSSDAKGTAEIKCTKCGYIAVLELGGLTTAACKMTNEKKLN